MSYKSGIKVFAPATIANLNIGFDILGLAIDGLGDEILLKPGKETGIIISGISNDKKRLPRDPKLNAATIAGMEVLKAANEESLALEMHLTKKMPICSGLGSSGASAVAGAFAVNSYLGTPFSQIEVLKFAQTAEIFTSGSNQADNIAASLLGGIILIRDSEKLDLMRLPMPQGMFFMVIHPAVEVVTKEARKLLSEKIKLKDHVKQTGNLAAFIHSLWKSDFELMRRSLHDHVIESQRKHNIPLFDEMKNIAMNENAVAFGISGSGPSCFVIATNSLILEAIKKAITKLFHKEKTSVNFHFSMVNQKGAFKY